MTRALCLALVLAASSLATPARADDASEAALQFELGRELYRQRRYAEALERFVASNRLVPNAGVMFNIAQTYQLLRRNRDAYNWYETYLRQDTSDEDRAAAERARDRLLRHVAVVEVVSSPPGATLYVDRRDLGSVGVAPRRVAVEAGEHRILADLPGHHPAELAVIAARGEVTAATIELRPRVGTLRVTSVPDEATVLVDEEPVGQTPLTLELPVGRHRVDIRRVGFVAASREVAIDDDETAALRVALERAASEVAVLTLSGNPIGATVVLDGTEVGALPLSLPDVRPGRHVVRVEHPAHEPWESELPLEAGGATRVEVRLVEEGAGDASWRFVTYAIGGALAVAGAITGALALGARSDFFESNDPTRGDLDRVRRLNRVTDVLLATGLLTLGVTFTFDLVRDRPSSRGTVSIDR